MNEETNNPLPDEEPTQTLNRLVGEVRTLNARLTSLETMIDAQSRQTNANLLAAFAEVLKTELEPIKEAQARMETEMRE